LRTAAPKANYSGFFRICVWSLDFSSDKYEKILFFVVTQTHMSYAEEGFNGF
jgi:hypothetical protein